MTVRQERLGSALVVTLDRPETKNALDRQTARDLGDAMRRASEVDDVRGVIFRANSKSTFISGGDIGEIRAMLERQEDATSLLAMSEAFEAIERCEVPVIAAVDAHVYGGGCELLLFCDLVVVEPHVTLAFRQTRMGLTTAWGGATRLVECVGPLEAARLLYTAATIDAERAVELGLALDVVHPGEALDRAAALVREIEKSPRAAVAAMKRALKDVRAARRGSALDAERAAFSSTWAAPAHHAAVAAFFARRRSDAARSEQ